MTEPIANIFHVCEGCNEERKATTQRLIAEHNLKPEDLIGAFVKLAFLAARDRREYMWVMVQGVGEQEDLLGELNNDPVVATAWTCGDKLEFMMDEIIEILVETA